jgi:hypothetical protein
MLLTTINDKIEVILGAAVTTNQLHVISSYNDGNTAGVTPTKTVTVTSGTTAVNLVPSPASSRQRSLRFASIFNCDSKPSIVTVRINYNATIRNVITVTLQVNEYLQYTHRTGWKVFDINGSLKSLNLNESITDNIIPEFFSQGTSGTLSLGTTTFCQYIGKATGSYTTMTISYNSQTTMATPTWAEIAIYKGLFTMGSNVTVTRCGFTDMSTIWLKTAATNIGSIITTTGIIAGDDLWLVYGNSATTSVGLKSVGLADDIGTGFIQTAGSLRPSLNATLSCTLSTTLTGIKFSHSSF